MARMRTGKQVRLTQEEKQALKTEKEIEREIFESKNMGKYILLYPLSENTKEQLKNEQLAKGIMNEENEVIPDQWVPQHTDNSFEIPVENTLSAKPDSEVKTKLSKKKSVEDTFDGDIYK